MYARVTTFQFKPGMLAEGIRVSNESIVPALRQQPGIKSFLALQGSSTGKAMLITLFETEADTKAGVSNGLVQQQAAKIAPLLAIAPVIEFYEVSGQE